MDKQKAREARYTWYARPDGWSYPDTVRTQAYRDALAVWSYLAEHGEIRDKRQLPAHLVALIVRDAHLCPLCSIHRENVCAGCPLDGAEDDDKSCPLFEIWSVTGREDFVARQEAAKVIAARIAGALEGLDEIQPAIVVLPVKATARIPSFDDLSNEERRPYIDEAQTLVRGLYGCSRVQSAWAMGTMSQDDFYAAEEDTGTVMDVAARLYEFTNTRSKQC